MAFILLSAPGMSVPVRPYPGHNTDATVRRAVPEVLLQLSRGEDNRPTAPAPFWVARIEDSSIPPLGVIEPEPRQTTPSIVKLSSPRRRWLSILSAAAMVLGGVAVANVFSLVP
jgi:hypothetical protein